MSAPEDDVERRLSKALRLIEKLRSKYDFEKQVGQELAQRNETLKRDLFNESERNKHLVSAFDELISAFNDISKNYERVLTEGLPTDAAILSELKNVLDDHRETADRMKRFALPPNPKNKKKHRRASEVGINIQAEEGTSLTRSRNASTADIAKANRNSVLREDTKAPAVKLENPLTQEVRELTTGLKGLFNRKDTVDMTQMTEPELNKPSDNLDKLPSKKSSVTLEGVNDLDFYSALTDNIAIPLFEHFIVVGVSVEHATEVLEKLNKAAEAQEAMSSRWLRKLGLSRIMNNNDAGIVRSPSAPESTAKDLSLPTTPASPGTTASLLGSLGLDSGSTSRESSWNIFGRDDEATSRSTFSGPSSSTSTTISKITKSMKLFGNGSSSSDSSTSTGISFFGKGSRRQSTSTLPSESADPMAPALVKRSDSAPLTQTDNLDGGETHIAPIMGLHSIPESPEGRERVLSDESDNSKVASEDPTTAADTRPVSSAISRISGTLSRMASGPSAGGTLSSPTAPSTGAFGISFGRTSTASLSPDPSDAPQKQTADTGLKLGSASSFLFTDEHSKPSIMVTPKKETTLEEFNEELTPGIIFRYPDNVAPPPVEVADFCMPVGAKLYRINPREEETLALKILYSHEGTRSSRCFIFMLEDRTADNGPGDDELGDSTSRLYGICVLHHRLLLSKRQTPSGGPIFEFVTPVCYCFITRFPLFDFFFQVIWSMISGERVLRMEGVQQHPDDDNYDRKSYKYIPEKSLSEILLALSKTKPPMFSERVVFSIPAASTIIEHMRLTPPPDVSEHYANAALWALPVLLDWMSPRLLTWAIGLLLCEVKVIVIGHEPGMVSCAVMSLMSLLRPLSWVAPLIPILPLKHLDFIEAPVPIIAGVVLDGEAFSLFSTGAVSAQPVPSHRTQNVRPSDASETMYSEVGIAHPETAMIVKKCLEKDSLAAVVDLTVPEIYVSSTHTQRIQHCLLPGALQFLEDYNCRRAVNRTSSNIVDNLGHVTPQYSVTHAMKEDAKLFQEMMQSFLTEFVDTVEPQYQKAQQTRASAVNEHLNQLTAGRNQISHDNNTPFKPAAKLESFMSDGSLNESRDENPTKIFGDEFAAEVEDVSSNLAAAVAAALQSDDREELLPASSRYVKESNVPEIEEIVGLSSLPMFHDFKAEFLSNLFETQIFCEYMEELNLGMECLADSEIDDNPLDNPAVVRNATRNSIIIETANTQMPSALPLEETKAEYEAGISAKPSSMSRPGSVEIAPSGGRSARKGRLSLIISGGVDTLTGLPLKKETAHSAAI